ncbi:hypothetical protein K504DRAFT_464535 [Pleomassaria siparia CBS 279.74]|uniref:Secreted protein n=1 Tax=Pleomassaria siparia CBS 279.74 TaxID=1314801 RepID=A0A6G1KJ65_9PLEO|nr:hypothetical protein K504DRAFT_464535 [Pleomassaria siparia CBS 279.74]
MLMLAWSGLVWHGLVWSGMVQYISPPQAFFVAAAGPRSVVDHGFSHRLHARHGGRLDKTTVVVVVVVVVQSGRRVHRRGQERRALPLGEKEEPKGQ